MKSGEPKGEARGREDLPDTNRTWIDEQLERGADGRRAVWRHVMEIYTRPFEAYVRRRHQLGADGVEVVHEFFAKRMSEDDYLGRWRRDGRRLRDWLLNGIDLEILTRRRKRSRGVEEPLAPEHAEVSDADARAVFLRASARALFDEAYRRAAGDCRARGLEAHWRVLEEHVTRGRPYDEVSEEFGVTPVQAADMKRTAAARLKRAVEDVLLEDGVPRLEIPEATIELTRWLGGAGPGVPSP